LTNRGACAAPAVLDTAWLAVADEDTDDAADAPDDDADDEDAAVMKKSTVATLLISPT